MLLVDDDRGRASGTGANTAERVPMHDARCAAAARAPGRSALAVGERGMQRGDRHREALAEARDELRREPDLRHQHQRPRARRERLLR